MTDPSAQRVGAATLMMCALVAAASANAQAQTASQRIVSNPPLLEPQVRDPAAGGMWTGQQQGTRGPPSERIRPPRPPGPPGPPRVPMEAARELRFDLEVAYVDGELPNPATQRNDKVRLRSYKGPSMDPEVPFVSPMIDIRPGSTVRMNLRNRLPADPSCLGTTGDVNQPHCFNGTNLHSHGLWVSPTGNSDNVLIAVNPGVDFEYEYNIPSDHPAGTFWYHTHLHGSTALQVSSGMAGALIVRGDRPPTPTTPGDLDTLLRPTPVQPFTERVVVFQQIQYACRDANGAIKTQADGTYRCDEGDVGGIEPGPNPANRYDLFAPPAWDASGRYTTINGRVLPIFQGATPGRVERWRAIHGGVRDTINLEFRKLQPGAAVPGPALAAASQAAFIDQNCTGEPVAQHLVAADGLTMKAALVTRQAVFQPGYRWDVLMVFPEAGRYCVIDAAAPASGSVSRVEHSRRLLAMVEVGPGRPVAGDATAHLAGVLAQAAAVNMPANVRRQVAADLRDGLRLTHFVPHPDIGAEQLTGKQELVFNIDVRQTPPQFQVNGQAFNPGRIDRNLTLGGVDEWTMSSDFASHPFHIHVNPFQIVEIRDPAGRDVSAVDAVDDAGGALDPQYRGLKGVWKDTIWVKNLFPPGAPPGKYTVVARTRYQRYIGDFVLHCHILDHEDQGMMQMVRISLPDGAGGLARSHHGH